MASSEHPPTDTRSAPPAGTDRRAPVEQGYETRDVNIGAILWLGAGTIIGAVLVHAGLWFLLGRFGDQAAEQDPVASPLADAAAAPPGPRLQDQPYREYAAFRAEQESKLNSYGWVDKQQNIVRIPVSRAMELALERGLPEPKAQEPDASEPTADAPKLRTDEPPDGESEGKDN